MLRVNLYNAITFSKTLTLTKLFNGFKLRFSFAVSRLTGRYWHWGLPESLALEPANVCNLMCPECPTGNLTLLRPKQFMPVDLAQQILEQAAPHLMYLQLFFQGEPLMHPRLTDIISRATALNIYTATSTNGHYLTPQICQNLIEAGLKRLIVSVDGTTPEVYNRYRVGGNLNTVIEGIGNMVAAKKQMGVSYPFLIIQMVVFKTNEHQIADIKRLTRMWGADACQLKSAQLEPFEKGHPLMPVSKVYNRYRLDKQNIYHINRNKKFKCWRTWRSAVFTADGTMVPCCFDKNGQWAYGTLQAKTAPMALFKSDKAEAFRKKIWQHNTALPMCQNCTEGLRCRH